MSDCSKMPAASAWPGPWKAPWMRAPDWPLAKVPSGPTAMLEKITVSTVCAVPRSMFVIPSNATWREGPDPSPAAGKS